jgi:hypothetical protein
MRMTHDNLKGQGKQSSTKLLLSHTSYISKEFRLSTPPHVILFSTKSDLCEAWVFTRKVWMKFWGKGREDRLLTQTTCEV